MNKKTIVYLNPDCFSDTDLTVLNHLSDYYNVIWFFIHESNKQSCRLSIADAIDYAEKFNIDIHVVDPRARYRNPKNLLFYWRIANKINRINPDLVYHCQRIPYWGFAVKYKLKCKNVILGVHDVQLHSSSYTLSRFMESVTKDYSLKVHKYFVTFSKNQKELLKRIYGKESFMVGMSCKFLGYSNEFLPDINNGVKLLFFGSINKYKGLDLLIESLEQLRKEGIENLKLTIAGKGDYWSICKDIIRTRNMYNLQIRFICNTEIPDLMASHHFLVLPYRDATQSGPLATAIAYELPVIAPAFGCFSETYNSESAILYSSGHLADALMKASSISKKKYEDLRFECSKLKEIYSENAIAKRYMECFNNVILGSEYI